MLLRAERRGLAGGAARHQRRRSFGDLPLDQIAKGPFDEGAIGVERRDERRD